MKNHNCLPKVIGIEISRGCNRNCHYCPKSQLRDLQQLWRMPLEQFGHIIRNLAASGISKVDINLCRYGEPLMAHVRPFLAQYIAIAKNALPESAVWIYTSGDFLTPDLNKRLEKAGLAGLIVTDHGGLNLQWYQGRVWKSSDLSFK